MAVLVLGVLAHLPGLAEPVTFHDEAITLQLLAGHPQPDWPEEAAKAKDLRTFVFSGTVSMATLVGDLRDRDVHPPIYFLVAKPWRDLVGPSLVAVRVLSTAAMIVAAMALLGALRRGGHPAPVWSALFLVCLAAPAIVGQAARPYSLALCFLCVAAWCLESALQDGRRSWTYASGLVVCCHLAFLTAYLAIFPVAVLLGAFFLRSLRRSRGQAVLVPVVTLISWAPWAGFIAQQSAARPDQDAGFPGFLVQIGEMWSAHGGLLVYLQHPSQRYFVVGLAVVLAATWLFFRRPEDRAFSWLLIAWATAPTLGILAMNLAFDKHLAEPRYFQFALPGVVGILGYAMARIPRSWIVGILFILIQFAAGVMAVAVGTAPLHLAKAVVQAETESVLVVVGTNRGFDGFAGQIINELDDGVDVIILDEPSDIEVLQDQLVSYREVWLLAPPPIHSQHLEDLAFQRILESQSFRVVKVNDSACHLMRKAQEPISSQPDPMEESRPPIP